MVDIEFCILTSHPKAIRLDEKCEFAYETLGTIEVNMYTCSI